jgi:DNA-binding response OmpR family regulator
LHTPAAVVFYGHDELLLMTRRRILEGAGFRADVTSEVKEIPRLVCELSADLVVLCHSLSRTECVVAGMVARNQRPEVRTLLLVADGFFGERDRERDTSMSEVADDILTLSLEPERLVSKVRSMLKERPQGRVMVFPEQGRMRGSDLARTS